MRICLADLSDLFAGTQQALYSQPNRRRLRAGHHPKQPGTCQLTRGAGASCRRCWRHSPAMTTHSHTNFSKQSELASVRVMVSPCVTVKSRANVELVIKHAVNVSYVLIDSCRTCWLARIVLFCCLPKALVHPVHKYLHASANTQNVGTTEHQGDSV